MLLLLPLYRQGTWGTKRRMPFPPPLLPIPRSQSARGRAIWTGHLGSQAGNAATLQTKARWSGPGDPPETLSFPSALQTLSPPSLSLPTSLVHEKKKKNRHMCNDSIIWWKLNSFFGAAFRFSKHYPPGAGRVGETQRWGPRGWTDHFPSLLASHSAIWWQVAEAAAEREVLF